MPADYGHDILLEDNTGSILLEDGSGVLLLETSPGPLTFNDYLFVKVGDGMSTSEKIR